MVDSDLWIEELLELGVGALAVQTLYRLNTQQRFSGLVCPRCGYKPRKWAAKCKYCRISLVRERCQSEETLP